jgi:hypothetical protein
MQRGLRPVVGRMWLDKIFTWTVFYTYGWPHSAVSRLCLITVASEYSVICSLLVISQHADLLMPRGRGRKLSRNVRRTLAQRALLPKTLNQLMPVSASAAGGVLSVNANSHLFLSTCVSSQSVTADSSRPSVITMAPNEIRVRRIVPTPVAVQCSK